MLTTDKSNNDNDSDKKCKQRLCNNNKNQPISPQHSHYAKPSMSPTYRDTAQPPALGNPNTRAPLTTVTSITTTSTASTTIKSASSVRTRCNLIGKMINDVSTAMRAATTEPKATNTTTALEEPAVPNNDDVVVVAAAASDFHEDNNTSTLTIDAGNMINMQRFPAATQEHKSKLTTAAAAASMATTTAVGTLTKRCTKPHDCLPAASSSKSEPTENKCAAKESSTLSYQREVELNRTFAQLELDSDTNSERKQSKGLAEQSPQPSFAERNQKLKAEFLADTSSEQRLQLSQAEQKEHLERDKALPKESLVGDLKTRGLARKAPQHLKLRIPAAPTETQEQHKAVVLAAVLEQPKLTLVARRKLELQRRFEQQKKHFKSAATRTKTTTTTTCPLFPSVQQLRLRFDRPPANTDTEMIVQPNKLSDTASPESVGGNLLVLKSAALEQRQSPLSDEGCNLGQSPYSSDEDNDNVSIRTASTTVERKLKDKVARSASSDSALGLEVDEHLMDASNATELGSQHDKQRRTTLTVTDLPLRPALLPLAEPTALPDSPTSESPPANLLSQASVPSKVLLEERVVEIPEDPRNAGSLSSSRRESAQSCLSDYPLSECGGVRFVRTPSVVVSDYSDDVMCGITLEEIEYFRAQRLRRRRSSLDTASGTEKDGADGAVHSDVSASSSCSNLYYCGSTISALDGAECYVNGMRIPLAAERKASACSTCSASGGEEDDAVFSIPEQPEESEGRLGKDLAVLLAAQQLNTRRPKKVGMCEQCSGEAVGGE